jgi:hypothetical protein
MRCCGSADMTVREMMEDSSPPMAGQESPDAAAAQAAGGFAGASGFSPPPAHSAPAPLENRVASLASALRRARIENAEHSSARVDVRAAEIARLELLSEALVPVLAQTPDDCDLFDVAIAPGSTPRMFIDHIGFIEMARDRRTYRFLQDTRHGRITLIESDRIEEIVDAVTDYIAHRLIEREKALAIDHASGGAVAALRRSTAETKSRPSFARKLQASAGFQTYLFLVETFGATVFFTLLAAIAYWIYRTGLAG